MALLGERSGPWLRDRQDQRHVDGVLVPDSREVQVDGETGNVFSFMDRRIAYGPVPSPAIGRRAAIEKATAMNGISPAKVGTTYLALTSVTPGGIMKLYWLVAIDTALPNVDEGVVVAVDAITGEASIIGAH
jgi:Zn-dependent metalloprotease